MRKLIFAILMLLLSVDVFAAAYNSNGTGGGNWSVGASWNPVGVPGAGDTVTILAGDTISIDGNITIGSTPGNDTTYDVDILGTLQWPANPGASWVLTFSTSVKIQNGGKFQIGTGTGARLDCDYEAEIVMDTNGNPDYDIKVEDGGELNWYGCEDWLTSGSVGERARISACSTSPCTGASTLTLDRAVDWDDCNADATFCAVVVGVGGSDTTAPGANVPEIITSYTNAANNQISLNLGSTHQVGDMVAKFSRNILIHSNSATSHGCVYSTGGEVYISWVRFDEMGDSTASGAGGATFNFSDSAKNVGTLEYFALSNCEDGGGVTGIHLYASEIDACDNCYVFDNYVGYGIYIDYMANDYTIKDSVTINAEGSTRRGNGVYTTNTATGVLGTFDGAWCCRYSYGLYTSTGMIDRYMECLSHGDGTAIYHQDGGGQYVQNIIVRFDQCEIRNADIVGVRYNKGGPPTIMTDCDFDLVDESCILLSNNTGETFWFEGYDNTFDKCNDAGIVAYAAIYIDVESGGYYYGQNEKFGVNTPNEKANIMINYTQYNESDAGPMRFTCNNCILTAETAANWAWPIYVNGGSAFQRTTFLNHHSYLTLHNLDQVEGDHWGWGPGGMIIERDTAAPPSGAWVDGTLYLKVTPGSAVEYHRIPLGTTHVDDGDNLTVNLQVQKDEAQADGRRPRLTLQGCGFIPIDDYDEMPNTQNTWETVEVTGAAEFQGVVHIYMEVKNEYSGAANKAPTWPATLEIWADDLNITNAGP